MKVNGMNLDGVFSLNNEPTGNDGMATLGNKLVDALIQSGELWRGNQANQGNQGMGIRDVIELMRLMQKTQSGGEPTNAKDMGLAEIMKYMADSQREQTRLILEQIRKDPPKSEESDADKFMKSLAFNMIEGNLKHDPSASLRQNLEQVMDLQNMFHKLSPQQQNSVEERLRLLELEGNQRYRDRQLELQQTHSDREFAIREKELDGNENRLLEALGFARDYFADKRKQSHDDLTPQARTAAAATPQTEEIGLLRISCQNCHYHTLMPSDQQWKFCPNCGDPKVPKVEDVTDTDMAWPEADEEDDPDDDE